MWDSGNSLAWLGEQALEGAAGEGMWESDGGGPTW